jgi:hypothetical protein
MRSDGALAVLTLYRWPEYAALTTRCMMTRRTMNTTGVIRMHKFVRRLRAATKAAQGTFIV